MKDDCRRFPWVFLTQESRKEVQIPSMSSLYLELCPSNSFPCRHHNCKFSPLGDVKAAAVGFILYATNPDSFTATPSGSREGALNSILIDGAIETVSYPHSSPFVRLRH